MGIIKDLFISILIVVCLALLLGVFFYEDIAISKVVPESEDYLLSEDMQQELLCCFQVCQCHRMLTQDCRH